jgi:prepilin-type N-terminal cleavage/methylation domain-containing protein
MAKKPFLASRRSRRAAAVGMTLIEVLVALVIFALGMLGAGGLMLASLRSGQFSRNASIATSLARDYSDIMQMIPPSVHRHGQRRRPTPSPLTPAVHPPCRPIAAKRPTAPPRRWSTWPCGTGPGG